MNNTRVLDKINSSLSVHLVFLPSTHLEDIHLVCDSVTQVTGSCFLTNARKPLCLPVAFYSCVANGL